jgi:hypothetical protein
MELDRDGHDFAGSQVNGVQGYGNMQLSATNPTPTTSCVEFTPVPVDFDVTNQNDGNDLGTGTYANQPGSSGPVTFTKVPADVPASEATVAVGFGTGLAATVGQFRQTLNAIAGDPNRSLFKGRQVSEATGFGSNFDNCWFPGSTVPKFSSVEGSVWNVGYYQVDPPFVTSLNVWADDYIGWNTTQVDYYRKRLKLSSFPCSAQVPQSMYIATDGTSGSKTNYANDSVGASIISATQVSTNRAGVSQTTTYVTQ